VGCKYRYLLPTPNRYLPASCSHKQPIHDWKASFVSCHDALWPIWYFVPWISFYPSIQTVLIHARVVHRRACDQKRNNPPWSPTTYVWRWDFVQVTWSRSEMASKLCNWTSYKYLGKCSKVDDSTIDIRNFALLRGIPGRMNELDTALHFVSWYPAINIWYMQAHCTTKSTEWSKIQSATILEIRFCSGCRRAQSVQKFRPVPCLCPIVTPSM
jgi:hypothetical protein